MVAAPSLFTYATNETRNVTPFWESIVDGFTLQEGSLKRNIVLSLQRVWQEYTKSISLSDTEDAFTQDELLNFIIKLAIDNGINSGHAFLSSLRYVLDIVHILFKLGLASEIEALGTKGFTLGFFGNVERRLALLRLQKAEETDSQTYASLEGF